MLRKGSAYFLHMPSKKRGPKPGTLYKNVKRTDLGVRIAALRRERGLTQERLAKRAGLSQRAISYYERESNAIPVDRLRRIADALHVSIDEFLKRVPPAAELKANRAFLRRLELAKTLPPRAQKILSDMIDTLAEKEATKEKPE